MATSTADYVIRKGDTAPYIEDVLNIDASDYGTSVRLVARLQGNKAIKFTSNNGTIRDASTASYKLSWTSGLPDTVGVYDCAWEATGASGTTLLPAEGKTLEVMEDLR